MLAADHPLKLMERNPAAERRFRVSKFEGLDPGRNAITDYLDAIDDRELRRHRCVCERYHKHCCGAIVVLAGGGVRVISITRGGLRISEKA
jgi:hypothetical protein